MRGECWGVGWREQAGVLMPSGNKSEPPIPLIFSQRHLLRVFTPSPSPWVSPSPTAFSMGNSARSLRPPPARGTSLATSPLVHFKSTQEVEFSLVLQMQAFPKVKFSPAAPCYHLERSLAAEGFSVGAPRFPSLADSGGIAVSRCPGRKRLGGEHTVQLTPGQRCQRLGIRLHSP